MDAHTYINYVSVTDSLYIVRVALTASIVTSLLALQAYLPANSGWALMRVRLLLTWRSPVLFTVSTLNLPSCANSRGLAVRRLYHMRLGLGRPSATHVKVTLLPAKTVFPIGGMVTTAPTDGEKLYYTLQLHHHLITQDCEVKGDYVCHSAKSKDTSC